MKNNPVIECHEVQKSYLSGGKTQRVLQAVNLSLAAGESVAIIGASGSGKTTLLHLLGGLDTPDSGVIRIDGNDLAALKDTALAKIRNRYLAYIFQFHLLLPEFTALENAAMPLTLRREKKPQALSAARACLHSVGMSPYEDKIPGQLSGGERQRVSIARALAGSPQCILADEPTGNLDRKNADIAFDLLLNACRKRDVALVFVTHDERLAARADRTLTLTDGILSA